MWFKNKKEETTPVVEIKEVVKTTPVIEAPKPITKKIIKQLIVVNNRTNKEYFYRSPNDFGLSFDYDHGLLIINQRYDYEYNYLAEARLTDFSIVGIEWLDVEVIVKKLN